MGLFIIPGAKKKTVTTPVMKTAGSFIIPKTIARAAAPTSPPALAKILTSPVASGARTILSSPIPSVPFVGRPAVTPVARQAMTQQANTIYVAPPAAAPKKVGNFVIPTVQKLKVAAPVTFQGRPNVTPVEQVRLQQNVAANMKTFGRPVVQPIVPVSRKPIVPTTVNPTAQITIPKAFQGTDNPLGFIGEGLAFGFNLVSQAVDRGVQEIGLKLAANPASAYAPSGGLLHVKWKTPEEYTQRGTDLANWAQQQVKMNIATAEVNGLTKDKASFLYQLGAIIPTLGGAFALTAITHSPTAASVLFAAYTNALSFGAYKDAGISTEKAASAAALKSIGQGLLMAVPLNSFFTTVGPFAEQFAIRVGGQALAGASRQVFANVVDATTLEKWKNGDVGANMKTAMTGVVQAALVAAAIAAPMAAYQSFLEQNGYIYSTARAMKADMPGHTDAEYLQGAKILAKSTGDFTQLMATPEGTAWLANAKSTWEYYTGENLTPQQAMNVFAQTIGKGVTLDSLFAGRTRFVPGQPAATPGEAPAAETPAAATPVATTPTGPVNPVTPYYAEQPTDLHAVWHSASGDFPVTILNVAGDMTQVGESAAQIPSKEIMLVKGADQEAQWQYDHRQFNMQTSKAGLGSSPPAAEVATAPVAPTRFVIPTRTATAPVSRILPHAAEAPAVSSPVATISPRETSVSPSTGRILPRPQAETTQPIPRAVDAPTGYTGPVDYTETGPSTPATNRAPVVPAAPITQPAAAVTKQPYSVDLPDGSRLTITPPAAATPTEQVAPAIKQPWQMTQDEYMNRRPIPAMQGKLPETGTHPAVETVDGSIFTDASDTPATHVQMIRDLGIPPERLKSGGWIVDGVYEPTARSDTMKYAEQEQAKTRVEQKQAIRRALSEGKDVPSEVLASYPDLEKGPSAAISTPETSVATSAPATTPQTAQVTKEPWKMTKDEYDAQILPNKVAFAIVKDGKALLSGTDNKIGYLAGLAEEQGADLYIGDSATVTVGTQPLIMGHTFDEIKAAQQGGVLNGRPTSTMPKNAVQVPTYTQAVELARSEGKIAPTTAPVVASAAKEPWQMTQTEYAMNMWESELQTFRNRPDILDGKDKAKEITHFRELHAGEVARAIAVGKPVPSQVLAEYPDLKATAPAAVTPAAVTPTIATDPLTGLGTPEAWQTVDKTDKIVATIDMNALLTNSKQYGPDFANTLRVIVAGALQQEGVQGYGLNKIEVAALFPSQEEADAKMAAVQKIIEETAVNATVDGKTTTLTGWRLDYGTGDDKESADAALAASRTDLARSRWNVQPVRSPAGTATQRKGDPYAANLAVGLRPEASSQQQIAKNNATPWVALGVQPTPRELLNGITALGYTLSESSRQMFDPKELNKLPMLQKLFRKSGTKVIGLDELASTLFSEYGVDRPQGDLQADDWLAQQLVAGASKGAGNATKDLFGGEIRTRAVAPTEALDTELFGKGQKAAFTTAQKNAAERGRHLQGQNQRTEQVRQAPVDEGILAGEVAGLPFDALNGNLGTNASVTGQQTNQPTTAGYEMNVTPSTGTTARTIAAENLQKVALAVKDYVTTLAAHRDMKESTYHAQLQDRLKQLGVPAGLFTPTQILSMYRASSGPSRLWNLTNRVLMRLNAYNTAQTLLADALNDVPASVLTKTQGRTLQDATLDGSDLMRSLDFIDRELTKAQVTADLREKFDTMLAAEKDKAAVRLAKMAHRVDAAKLQAEWDAAAKDAALKDKATRDKAILQINRSLAAVKNNVESGHTIALANVDNIRAMTQGSVTSNKLTTAAIHARTTDQLEHLAGAIKTQIALGRLARMSDVAVRKQEIADTVAERLPHIKTMSGYQEKTFDDKTYRAVVSRLNVVRNDAAKFGIGMTPAESIYKLLGMLPMFKDMSQGLDGAIAARDIWDKEGLDEAIADGVATDLQQRRIGIWLINQTSGGRNHLLHTGVPGHFLTEQQIDDIQLTPDEMKFAEAWRIHADKNFPILRDFFRDFHNIEITPVDMYTTLLNSSEFQSNYDRATKELTFQGSMTGLRHTPKVGEAITRTGGNNAVETNIMRIWRSYDETLAYAVNLAPPLAKWWGVAQNEDVTNKLGALGNLYIRTDLTNLTYRGGPGGHATQSGLDRGLDIARRHLSRGQILFRPTSALVHLMQIANVAGVTGPSYVIKATGLLASHNKKYGDWVTANFPRLRDSVRNYFEILGIEDDKLAKVGGTMFKWCHNAARVTGAIANYMWLCQRNGITLDWDNPDKDMLYEAMNLVNKEFGSEDIVSAPLALETGFGFADDKSLARLMIQFQQDVLAKFDLIKTQLGDSWTEKDPKKFARSLLWLVLVSAGLVAGVRYGYKKLVSLITGKKGVVSNTYLNQYFTDMTENIPFGNWITGMLQYGDIPIPVLSTLGDTFKQTGNFFTFKSGYAKLRAAIRAATDLGSLSGVVGIGTFGQIVTGIIPTGTTAPATTKGMMPGSTKAPGTKPTKPPVAKPHK